MPVTSLTGLTLNERQGPTFPRVRGKIRRASYKLTYFDQYFIPLSIMKAVFYGKEVIWMSIEAPKPQSAPDGKNSRHPERVLNTRFSAEGHLTGGDPRVPVLQYLPVEASVVAAQVSATVELSNGIRVIDRALFRDISSMEGRE